MKLQAKHHSLKLRKNSESFTVTKQIQLPPKV